MLEPLRDEETLQKLLYFCGFVIGLFGTEKGMLSIVILARRGQVDVAQNVQRLKVVATKS